MPKPNGHALPLISHSLAASVDAGGDLVAGLADSPAPASAIPGPYAEVAPTEARGTRLRNHHGAAPRQRDKSAARKKRDSESAPKASDKPRLPPGAEPLPLDGRDYVEAVHEKVDLIELEVKLLSSKDEKIVQRELAYLRELRYGKSAAVQQDDEPRIIFDLPRPKADPADPDS